MCLGEAGVLQVLQKRRWRELKHRFPRGWSVPQPFVRDVTQSLVLSHRLKNRLERLICVVGETICVVLWVTSSSGSQRWLTAEN